MWGDNASAPYPSGLNNPGTAGWDGTRHGIKLVKIGAIEPGAVVPAGPLGYFRVGDLRVMSISVTPMNVVAASCQSPENITVDLGKPSASEFKYEKYNKWSPIRIQITNCPKVIKNIALSLKPTASSPAISPSTGVIGLNSSSTAKGIAIRIKNQDNSDFDFSKRYVVAHYDPGSASVLVELQAQLYPLSNGAEVTPGTVKAEIMYVLEYL
ncbi:type 1 fimbrial protein [Pseudomonas sp. B21-051]|uniref:fimbrial protein n=1 Tax=Pseudomonas sp. B21-051 TaxID=2895491 RepID=UPI00215FE66B|nr:fimbrial protein [Pseudomonas sp. B21-051]UVK90134.1 type 1 fimbrial protein [Pseudomonas sp. B21-051]